VRVEQAIKGCGAGRTRPISGKTAGSHSDA
jgi:hypothetical protein